MLLYVSVVLHFNCWVLFHWRLGHSFWVFEGILSFWLIQIKQLLTFLYMVSIDIYLDFSWVNTKECTCWLQIPCCFTLFEDPKLISKVIILYSYRQWIGIWVVPHLCQHLQLLIFLLLAFLMGVVVSNCGFKVLTLYFPDWCWELFHTCIVHSCTFPL